MAGRLDGKVAVVTGGASGIGKACALRFAHEGADIVVADLDEERAHETVAEVKAAGRGSFFVRTDTSKHEDCEELAARVYSAYGRANALVAAAGISHALYVSGKEAAGPVSPEREASFIINKPIEYWEKVLAVNLTGVMYTNRAFARRMVEHAQGGSIVNIASGAAKIPIPGAADYCVSKAGVWMLTKTLALELAPRGVRVNAIGPGFIETPMTATARADEARGQQILSGIPMGRFGRPEDIANTALFLASDEASYFTGEILFPDGGLFTG
ncbi:MAG: glucose 1-dehydrogenase [Dehalococcoidia bacterium]|nr:glucose 1-dehydrogenase [Dehalococcoidia bacterium]